MKTFASGSTNGFTSNETLNRLVYANWIPSNATSMTSTRKLTHSMLLVGPEIGRTQLSRTCPRNFGNITWRILDQYNNNLLTHQLFRPPYSNETRMATKLAPGTLTKN